MNRNRATAALGAMGIGLASMGLGPTPARANPLTEGIQVHCSAPPCVGTSRSQASASPLQPQRVAAVGGNSAAASSLATTLSPAPAFMWPLEQGVVTSVWGPRHGEHHGGLDIGAATGTPVMPVHAGQVLRAGDHGDYGLFVELLHPDGWSSRYGHLDQVLVEAGEHLAPDDLLGTVGATGNATGPHLHLELRHDGQVVDPVTVLP